MKRALPRIVDLAGRRRLAAVSLLSLVMAASEGAGFLLLVPIAALVEPTSASGLPGPLTTAIGWLGPHPSLSGLLGLFVLAVGLRALAEYGHALMSLEVSVRVVDGLRRQAMAALVAADWRALARMRQAENRAMMVSTIDNVSAATEIGFTFLKTVLSLLATGIAALLISPLAALAGLVGGVLVMAAYSGLRRRARSLGALVTERHRRIYSQLEENLDALRLVKSYGNEERARREVAAGFSGLRAVQRRFIADSARARVVLQFGGAALLALLAWLALEKLHYSPALLLPLVALFARVVPQLGALQDCWQQWAHAGPSLLAARDLIERVEAEAEDDSRQYARPPEFTRKIALDHVSLHHRDGAGVDGISLALHPGEALALVGPSGAGKSTLADLLGGLVAPDSGALTIDGVALDGPQRRAWRHRVAYVQQEPVLFTGSARENLLWASPEASEEALLAALQAAHAGFVLDLPGGLDCDLGEGGRLLSGGEKQRLALARALLRDPALLILDEATSALDPASDAAVAAAVGQLKGRCAILIIGHSGTLSSIADRTVRIEAGRLCE